jgi:hypothetical protein
MPPALLSLLSHFSLPGIFSPLCRSRLRLLLLGPLRTGLSVTHAITLSSCCLFHQPSQGLKQEFVIIVDNKWDINTIWGTVL